MEDKEGERDMCKALEDMCLHAEEKGIEEGREMGIRLTKKVYQLHQQGKSNIEIAKECGIELRTVEEILE